LSWSELPLHGGRVPQHLLKRMKSIAEAVVELMILEFGPEKFVERMANPFWFQGLNNVIGMDWDSSGSTTVVLGILKELSWKKDLGFLVLGGKGRRMLRIKEESERAAEILSIDPEFVATASKRSARMDSAFLQDGYEIYIHSLLVAEGALTVVQQGMNEELKLARRYQLTSKNEPWRDPHEAVLGKKGSALDLSSPKSAKAAEVIAELANERPKKIVSMLRALKAKKTLTGAALPLYRPVRPTPQLEASLRKLHEFGPRSKEELLLAPGAGPKVLRALALISHLVYQQEPSFEDPANLPLNPFAYAYAVGGKDGVPYPYDLKTADEVIEVLRNIIEEAKMGSKERLHALKGLRSLVERLRARELE